MPLSPGTRFGPYEIVGAIGAGGMGEVYRARDTRLGRDVAIKVSNAAFSDRFGREARAIAALNHQNVCTLHDVGADYLVMELVEGPTLAERIRQGPIPLEEALDIARQIALALAAAHGHGIVHRDLKPANVKLRDDGTVKVLDFGLAKALEPGDGTGTGVDEIEVVNSPTLTHLATQAGAILGTAAYMAPEQVRGKTVDKRADIWAFGCVLYEMLTARRPFTGEDASETLAAVLKSEPERTPVPARVRRLIDACLQKDRAKRLQDITDAWLLIDDEAAATPGSAARPWPAWTVAALLLVATIALAVNLMFATTPAWAPVRFEISAPDNTSFQRGLAVSPDGKRLAFTTGDDAGVTRIWVRELASTRARIVAGTEGATSVVWSPDGGSLAFVAGRTIRTIEVDGRNPPVTLYEAGADNVLGLGKWTPDGVLLLGGGMGGGAIRTLSAAGGAPVLKTTVDGARNESVHGFPTLLPDGRHFLYFRQSREPEVRGTYIGSLDLAPEQQSRERLLAGEYGVAYAGGPSGGYLLSLDEGRLMALPFDADSLRLNGEPLLITDRVANFGSLGHFAVGGSTLAYRAGDRIPVGFFAQVAWIDRNGNQVEAVGAPGSYFYAVPSPDGTRAAMQHLTTEAIDIWLSDLADPGRGITRLTFGPAENRSPVWSPTGDRIVFRSRAADRFDLYWKLANGAGEPQLLLQTPEDKLPTDWSRDGQVILFTVNDPTTSADIWMLRTSGDGEPAALVSTPNNENSAVLSPDGRWFAYVSDESGRAEVYVRPFIDPAAGAATTMTGRWQVSGDGGTNPAWRDDGGELFFRSELTVMAVDVSVNTTFVHGAPHRLFDLPAGLTGTVDLSGNGERFLLAVPTVSVTSPITVLVNWEAEIGR